MNLTDEQVDRFLTTLADIIAEREGITIECQITKKDSKEVPKLCTESSNF